MSSPDAFLYLNRFAGVLLCIPSFQANIAILNCLFTSSMPSKAHKILFVSTIMSLIVDIIMGTCLIGWFMNNSWVLFTPLVVALGIIKRIYSIASVGIMFRRFEAVSFQQSKWRNLIIYTSLYSILSIATAYLQYYAYDSNGWDSERTRDSDVFKYGYRTMNIVICSFFVFSGFATDVKFFLLKRDSFFIAERLYRMRKYYNVYVSLCYESILYIAFIVALVWSLFNNFVTSSIYIEQCLLSFSTLNSFYAVYTAASSSDPVTRSQEDPYKDPKWKYNANGGFV